ncbi:MAG: hypothetical protein ACOX0E_01880 [Syntrophomonadaceae bacterium]|jgi:hypothetical protein
MKRSLAIPEDRVIEINCLANGNKALVKAWSKVMLEKFIIYFFVNDFEDYRTIPCCWN